MPIFDVECIFKVDLCRTKLYTLQITPAYCRISFVTCLCSKEVNLDKSIKGDHKHLTLSDRIYIEQALIRGDNFREIAKHLSKSPSTISMEVRRFLEWEDGYYAFAPS